MLIDLPAELLTEICSHLCCHCLSPQNTADRAALDMWTYALDDQQDLRNFSRVCRTSHVAAEPFLYHRVSLVRERHLYLFIRTLLARPDLRSRVLELNISHSDSSSPRQFLSLSPGMAQRTSVLPPDSLGTELGDPVALREAAEHKTLASLLMGLVPNLKTFGMELPSSGFLQMPRVSPSSKLMSLRKLYFASFGPDFLLDRLAPMLRSAPNLQTLHCHRCTHVTDTFRTFLGRNILAEPPPLHNLTELVLVDCLMTPDSLRNLLKAVGPGLSKVCIRRPNNNPSPREGSELVGLDEAISLLRPWHHTLRELLFTIDGPSNSYHHRSHLPNVRFLREFTTLETLQVHTALLDMYGHEGPPEDALVAILPSSVRELRIFGFQDRFRALRGLSEALTAGQFTCLRRIGIDDQYFEGYEASGASAFLLRHVAASFQSGGVKFVVHS